MSDFSEPLSGVVLAMDVDGVLFDSSRDVRGHWKTQFIQRFGVDADELREAFFLPWWPDIIVGRQAIEVGLESAFATLGWDIDVEDALSCWFDGDFFVDEEVVGAVNEWASRGARVVLATNQERRRVAYLERRLAPLVPISGVAFSGELGYLKSETPFFIEAERSLGISSPEVVVFVDDTLENIEVAQRHGWLGFEFKKDSNWQSSIEALLLQAKGSAS